MMKGKGWWEILERQMFFKATRRARQGQESTKETDLQSCQNYSVSAVQPGHLFYLLTCSRAQTPLDWVLHKGGEGIPFMRTPIPLPLPAGHGSAWNDLGGCFQLLCKHSPCLDLGRLHSGGMAPWCSSRELKNTVFSFWGAAKCNKPFEGRLGRWIKTIWIFLLLILHFFKASRKSFWNARDRIRMAKKGGRGATFNTMH